YSLYREGVADRDVDAARLIGALPHPVDIVHTGSLALVPEDVHRVRDCLGHARDRGAFVSVDLNLRPRAVTDPKAYVQAVESVLPLCDLIKCSDEDLQAMGRLGSPVAQARLMHKHSGAAIVTVTGGENGATLLHAIDEVGQLAIRPRSVVDTIGAGDCFQAGLLIALGDQNLLSRGALKTTNTDALTRVLHHAQLTASLNVERPGCNPPTRAEIVQRAETLARTEGS
ncbi:MAG: PfkB family carbohydrate kinase, partial [Myxococcota bacterium]